MIRVLALDTTSEFGSIALVTERVIVAELPLHSPEGFGHILFGEIAGLLARHNVELAQIDAFASASGPGSFTGVRVGLTAAKGLAEATGRKVVAVSNLQALAAFGTGKLRATVVDARRGEVYGAVYDSELRLVCDEALAKLPVWLATLPSEDVELISSGIELSGRVVTEVRSPLAGAIGRIAIGRVAAGLAQDPAEIDANYVRRSDAELLWRD